MTLRLCLIVAMARNRVIGRDGGLPWHISADLKFFKSVTMGKPMIMGRRTFASIGRPLPGRTSIVVTRRGDFQADGVLVAHDMAAARRLAADIARRDNVDEIMVVGGGEIYALALPDADRIYLTEVQDSPAGNVTFPCFDRMRWREVSRQSYPPEGETPGFDFVVLEKI